MTSTSDLNTLDKLYNNLSPYRTMEQILEFALLSKVILSYKIDRLNSFYDQLVEGLWTKSLNGCFYKMDDCHEKFAYVVVNENFEADAQKSMKKLHNFSMTRKVFDEMSDKILSSHQNNDECLVIGNDLVSEKIDLQDGKDDHNEYNIMKQIGDELSGVPEVDDLESLCDSLSTENEQAPALNLYQVFDEIPKPDFILEMAQASRSIQGRSIDDDHELGSDEIYRGQISEQFLSSSQNQTVQFVEERVIMNEKEEMGADGDEVGVTVVLEKPRASLSTLSFLLQSQQCVSLILSPYVMFSSYFPVNTNSSFMPKGVLVVNTIDEVILDLMLFGFGSTESLLLRCSLAEMSFEIVFLALKNRWILQFSYKEVHDKGIVCVEEGKYATKECTWVLTSMPNKRFILTYVFDPGGWYFGDVHLRKLWSCCVPSLTISVEYMVIVLDGICDCTTWLPLLPNISCFRTMVVTLVLNLHHTLGDKGGLRREEMIRVILLYKCCNYNNTQFFYHLITIMNDFINEGMMKIWYIWKWKFDVNSSIWFDEYRSDKIVLVHLYYGMVINSRFAMFGLLKSMLDNLQACICQVDSLVICWCGFRKSFGATKMEVNMLICNDHKLNNFMHILHSGVYYSISESQWPTHEVIWVLEADLNYVKVFDYDMCGARCTRKALYKVYQVRIGLKLESILFLENGLYAHSDTIFIFDPGGLNTSTCSYLAVNLILEDKDHFERRVLIHTKYKWRGSLVICLLFLLPQGIIAYIRDISYL
ncbi:hypothetical protein RND81_13G065800 [Saponaria officinalis]|uniref:Uncharacterized protein n=1 Tax=Saponaria officinalis TaxID=3572 RepID=A0AAW1GXG3_SAPOF